MQMNSQVESSNKITGSIDGLRGLLATWVMLFHISLFVNGPGGLIGRGGVAVDLFMLVSGFLMVWTVLSRESTEPMARLSTWRKFYIRRIFRIAPLYFLLLVPAYFYTTEFSELLADAYRAIGRDLAHSDAGCEVTPTFDLLSHVTFTFGLFPCTVSRNILPDWSLSLEMQFYALFPILYAFLIRSRGFVLASLAAAVAGISGAIVSVYEISKFNIFFYPQASILPLRINCFLVGMILGVIVWRRSKDPLLLSALLICLIPFQRLTFIAISAFLILMLLARVNVWMDWTRGYAMPFRFTEAILKSPPLKYIGDFSFGIYLLHAPILLIILSLLNDCGRFLSLSGSVKFIFVFALSMPVVVSLAALLHKTVEKPMISIGHRLTSKRSVSLV